jgi:hypothetical protein
MNAQITSVPKDSYRGRNLLHGNKVTRNSPVTRATPSKSKKLIQTPYDLGRLIDDHALRTQSSDVSSKAPLKKSRFHLIRNYFTLHQLDGVHTLLKGAMLDYQWFCRVMSASIMGLDCNSC